MGLKPPYFVALVGRPLLCPNDTPIRFQKASWDFALKFYIKTVQNDELLLYYICVYVFDFSGLYGPAFIVFITHTIVYNI